MELLTSQSEIASKIVKLAKIYFNKEWSGLQYRPRLNPLIAGPTGSGKSHLVREIGKELGLKVFRATIADWIPRSYRGHAMAERIEAFMMKNPKGIIHIDEMDKLTPSTGDDGYYSKIRVEVFNMIDRVLFEGQPDNYFFIGSGTWQHIWDTKPNIGYNPTKEEFHIDRQTTIPQELLTRFNKDVLELNYPTVEEITVEVEKIHTKFNIVRTEDISKPYLESKKGVRYLEEYVTNLLVETYVEPVPVPAVELEATPITSLEELAEEEAMYEEAANMLDDNPTINFLQELKQFQKAVTIMRRISMDKLMEFANLIYEDIPVNITPCHINNISNK